MAGPLQPPKTVRMVDDAGQTQDVPASEAALAESQGYHIETPHEAKVREYIASGKGDSWTEGAKAAAEHGAGFLSLGLSDALLAGVPGYRESRAIRDETHQSAGTLGTIGAALVPLAGELSGLGAAGKVAKVAGAPLSTVSRAASTVGKAAERAIAGEAPGAARNIVAKGVGGTLSGMVEGSVIGAGQAISESALEDKPLAAELLFARMGDGAKIGGAFGGALGTASGLFGATAKGGRALLRHVPGIGEVVAKDAETIANTSTLQSLGFQRSDINRLVKNFGAKGVNEIGDEAQEILGLREPGAFERAIQFVKEDGAAKIGEARETVGKRIGEIYGEMDAAGNLPNPGNYLRRLDTEVLAPLKSSLSGDDLRIANAIESEVAPLRKRLEVAESYKTVGKATDVVKQRLADIGELVATGDYEAVALGARAFEREFSGMITRYRELGMGGAVKQGQSLLKALRSVANSEGKDIFPKMTAVRDRFNLFDESVAKTVAEKGNPGITNREIWDLAKKQTNQIRSFTANTDTASDAFREYWKILKDGLAEDAAKTGLGPELASLNQRLKRVIALDEVAQKAIGFQGNRKLGLTSSIAAAAGVATGAAGGPITAVLGGAAGSALNRLISSSAGDQMLAVTINRTKALREAYESSARAARALGKETVAAAPLVPLGTGVATKISESLGHQRELVLARQNQRAELLREIESRQSEAREVAPELTAAINASGGNIQNFLATSLPKEIESGGMLGPIDGPRIPESERALWEEKLSVAKRPNSVIEALKAGQLTHTKADAMRRAFPAMYQRAQKAMLDHLDDGAKNHQALDYAQRAQASVFTGVPVDASYLPQRFSAMQARHAARRQASTAPAPSNPRPPASVISPRNNRSQSGLDRRSI